MIFLATLALLLMNAAPKTSAALPNFLQDVEEDSTYHNCDSAMCWWTTFDIEVDSDFSVPNSSLVIADYNWDWWEVKTSSLLKECAPSLPLSQIAYSFSACNDMEDDSIKEACIAVQRGWLDENGKIKKTLLIQASSELPKAESFINECLALEDNGVDEVEEIFDYYDYSDYYDNDDYYDYYGKRVEEKGGSGGREKRSLGRALNARVEERKERRGRVRKRKRNGKTLEKKQTSGNGQQRENGGQKRRTSPDKKRNKKNLNSARKEKKKSSSGREESKKKKKQAKLALKKIGLKKPPSQLVLARLKCIFLAVDIALADCGRKVLKTSNFGHTQE